MTQPTMTCSKCGFVRIVTTSPEATERWWKKHHNTSCDGAPVYRAGFGPRSTLTGQQLHREPLD